MHNHDDKYPARPGFEPGTPRLQAPVDTNKPSEPAQQTLPFSARGPSLDVRSDVCRHGRRQILTSNDCPHTERIIHIIMTVHP